MKKPSKYVRNLTGQVFGQVFGRVTVIEYAGNNKHNSALWRCNCSCGTEDFIVLSASLVQGRTRSCGCLLSESTSKRRKKDLTGKKFGRWTVIKEAGKNKFGCIMWECICICLNKKLVASQNLLGGDSTSCGCYFQEIKNKQRLPPGRSIFNRIYGSYKCNAKQRNMPFELTKECFEELIQDVCFYCGHDVPKIYNHDSKGRHNGDYMYVCGVDRVDNSIGYFPSNCVSACELCNIAKRNMAIQDFLTWLKRITGNINNLEKKLKEKGFLDSSNIS